MQLNFSNKIVINQLKKEITELYNLYRNHEPSHSPLYLKSSIQTGITNFKQILHIPLKESYNQESIENDFLEIAEILRQLPDRPSLKNSPPPPPPNRNEYMSLMRELEIIMDLFYTKHLPISMKTQISQH